MFSSRYMFWHLSELRCTYSFNYLLIVFSYLAIKLKFMYKNKALASSFSTIWKHRHIVYSKCWLGAKKKGFCLNAQGADFMQPLFLLSSFRQIDVFLRFPSLVACDGTNGLSQYKKYKQFDRDRGMAVVRLHIFSCVFALFCDSCNE